MSVYTRLYSNYSRFCESFSQSASDEENVRAWIWNEEKDQSKYYSRQMEKNSLQCLHESSAQHFEACKQQKGEKKQNWGKRFTDCGFHDKDFTELGLNGTEFADGNINQRFCTRPTKGTDGATG